VAGFRPCYGLLTTERHATFGPLFPRLIIYLRDGRVFVVPGKGLKRSRGGTANPPLVSPADDFEHLIETLDRLGVPRWQGPREELVAYCSASLVLLAAFGVGFGVLAWRGLVDSYSEVVLILAILTSFVGVFIGFGVARLLRARYARSLSLATGPASGGAGNTRQRVPPEQ
jgi:hypothetical protein